MRRKIRGKIQNIHHSQAGQFPVYITFAQARNIILTNFADEESRKLRYMMNAVYSALPLTENEFRDVNILPGRFNDIVECTLSVRLIESGPVFKALSYVWGNASRARLILVNEVESAATTNLESAPRYLCYSDRPRHYGWT